MSVAPHPSEMPLPSPAYVAQKQSRRHRFVVWRSYVHGRGVFATRSIRARASIGVYTGRRYTAADVDAKVWDSNRAAAHRRKKRHAVAFPQWPRGLAGGDAVVPS